MGVAGDGCADPRNRRLAGEPTGGRELLGFRDSLPDCYLNAEVYTDKYAAYAAVIYDKYHHSEGKVTQPIERFNNTLRQRVPRLTRKTLSVSKSLQNHLGAIWLFVHHYNSALLP